MRTTPEMIESRHLFGLHLREIRKGQHLTQNQLGSIVGIDRSYISRLERGHCNVTLDVIVLLSNGLGITPAELLSGIATEPSDGAAPLPIMLGLTHRQSHSYHVTEM